MLIRIYSEKIRNLSKSFNSFENPEIQNIFDDISNIEQDSNISNIEQDSNIYKSNVNEDLSLSKSNIKKDSSLSKFNIEQNSILSKFHSLKKKQFIIDYYFKYGSLKTLKDLKISHIYLCQILNDFGIPYSREDLRSKKNSQYDYLNTYVLLKMNPHLSIKRISEILGKSLFSVYDIIRFLYKRNYIANLSLQERSKDVKKEDNLKNVINKKLGLFKKYRTIIQIEFNGLELLLFERYIMLKVLNIRKKVFLRLKEKGLIPPPIFYLEDFKLYFKNFVVELYTIYELYIYLYANLVFSFDDIYRLLSKNTITEKSKLRIQEFKAFVFKAVNSVENSIKSGSYPQNFPVILIFDDFRKIQNIVDNILIENNIISPVISEKITENIMGDFFSKLKRPFKKTKKSKNIFQNPSTNFKIK